MPLWSFGHGLSYTTFAYSSLTLTSQSLSKGQPLKLSVNVKNTGSVTGKEVVQVYVTDVVSSVVTPNHYLVGFEKIELAYVFRFSIEVDPSSQHLYRPGASSTVNFNIAATEFGLWNINNQWVVEPGQFQVTVGTSDQVYVNSTFTVTS